MIDMTIEPDCDLEKPEEPYRAVNRWDEDDFFDEWAKPSIPLSPEAEMIVGTTNERLMHCRPTSVVLDDFLAFLDW